MRTIQYSLLAITLTITGCAIDDTTGDVETTSSEQAIEEQWQNCNADITPCYCWSLCLDQVNDIPYCNAIFTCPAN